MTSVVLISKVYDSYYEALFPSGFTFIADYEVLYELHLLEIIRCI